MTDLDTVLDPKVLEDLLELSGGDHKFIEALVETFKDRAQALCEACREGLDEGDHEKIERVAHEIRSSSGQLGATRLPPVAKQLESQAEAKHGDLQELGERFLAEVQVVCDALDERVRSFATSVSEGGA